MNRLKAQNDAESIELSLGGSLVLRQVAQAGRRPHIHPLRTPDGQGLLTEDAPGHHPWQRGLYVGLNQINGVGFWEEGLGRNRAKDGSFHPAPLAPAQVEGQRAEWGVETQWKGPDGQAMLVEGQEWSYQHCGEWVELEMEWSLTGQIDLVFGQYDYGGLFLRMPYRKEVGGQVHTSEGLDALAAEGQPARWVAVAMELADRGASGGIALMDHPANPAHPVPWRVDGQLGISPSRCIGGAWRLAAGEKTTSRYRLFLFLGGIEADKIEANWGEFARV